MSTMLSRTSLLSCKRGRVLTASVISFAGGSLALKNYSSPTKSRLDGLSQEKVDHNKFSLVPAFEAGVRATRLIFTAASMVVDYKSANAVEKISSSFSFFLGTSDEEKQQRHWESELKKRKKNLNEAQVTYTTKSPDMENLDADVRQELKSQQKQEMLRAAELVTEAEDKLYLLGHKISSVHTKSAERLLKLCRDNAGVYIKIGQYIALLDYIIPQEYIKVLSSLFNEAPLTDYDSVCKVIEEDLGHHPDELFDKFDPVPIASASLAQVHVAYTKDTKQKVAVKVQHRGLRETSVGDLFALTCTVRVIESLFEEFKWGWILDEIKPSIPRELDFTNEGKNAEKAAAHLEGTALNCVVPKILWNKTSSRVLTMEFEEGFKATDIESIERAGLNKRDVARLISSVFNSLIFKAAFVHCDPHPANVLLREKHGKPQMVLIDHGLYRHLSDDFRIQFAKLWKSLMTADMQGIENICEEFGLDKTKHRLFAGMVTARPFDEIVDRSKTGAIFHAIEMDSRVDRTVIRGYAQHYFLDIVGLLDSLPRQMILILKMYDCLRHIDRALGSPTNTLVIGGQYAARALYEHNLQQKEMPFFHRFEVWLDYMSLVLRIQIQSAGLWLMQTFYKVGYDLALI